MPAPSSDCAQPPSSARQSMGAVEAAKKEWTARSPRSCPGPSRL